MMIEPQERLLPCCINIRLPAEPFHPDHKSGHPNHASSCSIKILVIGPTQVYNTVNRKRVSFFHMEVLLLICCQHVLGMRKMRRETKSKDGIVRQ
jgi:hypothetical protein